MMWQYGKFSNENNTKNNICLLNEKKLNAYNSDFSSNNNNPNKSTRNKNWKFIQSTPVLCEWILTFISLTQPSGSRGAICC